MFNILNDFMYEKGISKLILEYMYDDKYNCSFCKINDDKTLECNECGSYFHRTCVRKNAKQYQQKWNVFFNNITCLSCLLKKKQKIVQ